MAIKNDQKQSRMPRQARSRVTWAAIVEAATRILRTRDYGALTTNDIATVAGVGIGTLYGYFRNKDEIVLAVARSVLAEDRAAVLAALETCAPSGLIKACVGALVARHMTDRPVRRAVISFHLGRGFAEEHVEQVRTILSMVWAKLDPKLALPEDGVSFFVLSRAVLGVCRALTDEHEDSVLDVQAVELCLVELVERELDRLQEIKEAQCH
jgi:AcrR family transcriptional regulator